MKLLLPWIRQYQNHVGTYDKTKWEQSIEDRILHGITHIPTKSAKLGSDLIDLDLVQGSSFPKAKPKHGLFTVTKHALLRFLFLPFYYEWWSAQTSRSLFIIFILLYLAQAFNVALYLTIPPLPSNLTSHPSHLPFGPINQVSQSELVHQTPESAQNNYANVPIETSDILSPIVLMLILTFLHSQIVATHWSSSSRSPLSLTPRQQASPARKKSNLVKLPKQRRNSVGKVRKTRRSSSRYPRRRPSTLPLHNIMNLNCLGVPSSIDSCTTQSLSPSSIKKVFFEEDSCEMRRRRSIVVSASGSNSDKDEGIQILAEKDSSCPRCELFGGTRRRRSGVSEEVFMEKVEGKEKLEEEEEEKVKITLNECSACKKSQSRGGLRRRNLSKQSMSTETPSGSGKSLEYPVFPAVSDESSKATSTLPNMNLGIKKGAECSSNYMNYNSSSDDEGEEGEKEEKCGDEESEEEEQRADLDVDDEEVRKSEWTAVTTNSEDEDYVEEEVNNSEDDEEEDLLMNDHPLAWEFKKHSNKCISPSFVASDKVSCTIWEGHEVKKASLSVLDISALIIAKVERARENSDYLYLGMLFSCIIAFLPGIWRLNTGKFEIDDFDYTKASQYLCDAVVLAFGNDLRTRVIILISFVERFSLSLCVFFLLTVAEKTYKQRFLYSKLFSRLTSTRKSKKSGIPHFRLNKVRNIKTWLSIRSYLQRRGPQRSVDTIVSATFIATLILICFLSVELLKDSDRMYYLYNIEVISWSLFLGIYLMRFLTLGSKISQKYRNLSVIITEQLNLYLKIEQKPHKKEELLLANNVLNKASDLLKVLDDPFKISNFACNPFFYNVTRLVILSAFSGVLSEILGFKLKLYKFKIK